MSKELKIRERDFINRLIDPDSSTYANQTKSYQEAHNNGNEASSASQASELVRKPKIVSHMAMIVKKAGATIQDRVIELSGVYHGQHRREVETHSLVDGVMVLTGKVISEPSFMERVRARYGCTWGKA